MFFLDTHESLKSDLAERVLPMCYIHNIARSLIIFNVIRFQFIMTLIQSQLEKIPLIYLLMSSFLLLITLSYQLQSIISNFFFHSVIVQFPGMSVPACISSSAPCLLLHQVTSSDIQDTYDHRSCRFRLQRLKQTNVGIRLLVMQVSRKCLSDDATRCFSSALSAA